eukprot:756413-Hanusia_phi.AAC.4
MWLLVLFVFTVLSWPIKSSPFINRVFQKFLKRKSKKSSSLKAAQTVSAEEEYLARLVRQEEERAIRSKKLLDHAQNAVVIVHQPKRLLPCVDGPRSPPRSPPQSPVSEDSAQQEMIRSRIAHAPRVMSSSGSRYYASMNLHDHNHRLPISSSSPASSSSQTSSRSTLFLLCPIPSTPPVPHSCSLLVDLSVVRSEVQHFVCVPAGGVSDQGTCNNMSD